MEFASQESDHRCPQPRVSPTSGDHGRRGAGAPPTTTTRPSPRPTLRRYSSGGWGRPTEITTRWESLLHPAICVCMVPGPSYAAAPSRHLSRT